MSCLFILFTYLAQSLSVEVLCTLPRDTKDYKNRELIYILREITEEFVKNFYRGMVQRYNKATILVLRL